MNPTRFINADRLPVLGLARRALPKAAQWPVRDTTGGTSNDPGQTYVVMRLRHGTQT